MRSPTFIFGGVFFGFLASNCSYLPELPNEYVLPVDEILSHTSCELQSALYSLKDPAYKAFNKKDWLISVALVPSVDTSVVAGVGVTRRTPSNTVEKRFQNWVIGSAPGIAVDTKGQRTGGVTYNIKSWQLMDDTTLVCRKDTTNYHVLTQNLGIGKWLRRTAEAMNRSSTAELDKPSFNSDITIKFGGAGSYTYSFPAGTDLASLSGSYQVREQLNILMVPTSRPFKAVTLPRGGRFPDTSADVGMNEALIYGQSRLDVGNLESAIRSLDLRSGGQ